MVAGKSASMVHCAEARPDRPQNSRMRSVRDMSGKDLRVLNAINASDLQQDTAIR